MGTQMSVLAALLGSFLMLSQQKEFSPFQPEFKLPPPPLGSSEFNMEVDLVLLDVAVRNKTGWISDLKKENFQVRENGQPQEIRFFSNADVPVTVGIVMDSSASMTPKRVEAITAALTFIKYRNPNDEMFVITFNDRVSFGLPPEQPFSTDVQLLRAGLMSAWPKGRTALYDALAAGLNHSAKGKHGRKVLVVVSDGGDNQSALDWETTLRMVEESPATIYAIGVFDPSDKDKNPGVLKRLARITGGEAYFPEQLTELSSICEGIAKDIRNRYTIGYVPRHDAKTASRERTINVTANAPERGNLKIRTRTKYLAPEEKKKPSGNDTASNVAGQIDKSERD